MRLICPNCGAQYEVPPEAIPPAGRDVQCSACSRTWFERPSAPEPWELVPQVVAGDEEADDLAEAQSAPPPVPSPSSIAPPPPRSTVTPEVADILRAEAEREAQVRAEEAVRRAFPAVDQPDPVVVPPAPPPPPMVEERPSRPEPMREAAAQPARATERALDIEQINSSLRIANDRIGGRAPQVRTAKPRGGFARGFWGALLIVALLAGLYVAAPAIVAAVPDSAVVLGPYVAAVDAVRVWLDRQVGALLSAIFSAA